MDENFDKADADSLLKQLYQNGYVSGTVHIDYAQRSHDKKLNRPLPTKDLRQEPMSDEYTLTLSEASEMLSMSYSAVRKLLRMGILRTLRYSDVVELQKEIIGS